MRGAGGRASGPGDQRLPPRAAASTVLLLVLCALMNITGVKSSLEIEPSSGSHTLYAGNSFFVSCRSPAESVQRVMWTGPEGHQITDYKGRIHVEDGKAGHKGVDLVFDSITTKDKGRYTCSANVDGQDVEKSFTLNVIKGLDFSKTELVQYVEEGLDSTLKCKVDSDPKPRQIVWYRNDRAVKKGEKYDIDPSQPGHLIVRNATMSDGGQYKCQALQLSAQTSDIKFILINANVHHKPQWSGVIDKQSQAYGFVHGEVNLTCEAEAEPSANFTWLKNQKPVLLSDTVRMINQDHKSVLQLTLSKSEMFGDYTCKAENHLGTLERVIILSEGAKPLQPQAQVTKVETDKVELDLIPEEVAEMPIIGFKVEYKMRSEDWDNAPFVYFKKGDSYHVNGLVPDTEYNLRVSAQNAAGYSEYTNEIAKRTKPMKASQVNVSSASIRYASLSVILAPALVFLRSVFS